jgi:hypothetical protein
VGTIDDLKSGVASSIPALNAMRDPHELDDAELWAIIESASVDASQRSHVAAVYQQRQVDALRGRLDALSQRGLGVVSRYIAILLEAEPSEGFGRSPDEMPWSASLLTDDAR